MLLSTSSYPTVPLLLLCEQPVSLLECCALRSLSNYFVHSMTAFFKIVLRSLAFLTVCSRCHGPGSNGVHYSQFYPFLDSRVCECLPFAIFHSWFLFGLYTNHLGALCWSMMIMRCTYSMLSFLDVNQTEPIG